jgi:hypothetical protein
MTTSQPGVLTPTSETDPTLRRRGLLTATAAFVAGLVARFSETPVSAGVDGDVVLGQPNTSTALTSINNTTANGICLQTFCTAGTTGTGLSGGGSQFGVRGVLSAAGNSGAGVFGFGRPDSPGVMGGNSTAIGVQGISLTSYGVVGQSASGVPIQGQVAAGSSANTIAIYGVNSSSYAGPSPGAGGFAIYGLCANGHGLVGATAATGAAAVVGATNGVAGAYAAAFYGPVSVAGDFTVVAGAKSAAVPHPDGSHRRLYCMESPESWFEDFGIGRLECGRAEVTIDPDFAAVVDLTESHVFLTERGSHQALAVVAQTETGFVVAADAVYAAMKGKRESELTGTFSWRIVAKRKDIKSERLSPVAIPPEPKLPLMPDAPASPFVERASASGWSSTSLHGQPPSQGGPVDGKGVI